MTGTDESEAGPRGRYRSPVVRMLLAFPPFAAALESMPARRRPALFYETFSNIGIGALVNLFPISLVVLETILEADLTYQTIIASVFYGANLASPLVTYVTRYVRVRWLVIVPTLLMGLVLALTPLSPGRPLLFTIILGLVLGIRVVPRVGEMNMFRLLYPDTHVAAAVGWTRSVAAVSGLSITLFSWWWFEVAPEKFWVLYLLVAAGLVSASWFYSRIPVHRSNFFSGRKARKPVDAFLRGMQIFLKDRRFLRYELAFFIAGAANQMGVYLVPEVLNERIGVTRADITLIAVVVPGLTVILTAPVWGRYLSRKTPMAARAMFSLMQVATFALYAYGGWTLQAWPFFVGSLIHACSLAGGSINWLTGSLYFAHPEYAALYNGIHVFLTGVRGFVAPFVAEWLYKSGDLWLGLRGCGLGTDLYWISVALSAVAAVIFAASHHFDAGRREIT